MYAYGNSFDCSTLILQVGICGIDKNNLLIVLKPSFTKID